MQHDPFPYLVIDDWFDRGLLLAVRNEFPPPDADGWRRFANANEGKLEGGPHMWGVNTFRYFHELESRGEWLRETFKIRNLTMETVGGGYHLIPPGGRLEVHTDFNRSPKSGLYRRLNVLTYLNEGWDDEGGHLLLRGSDGDVTIAPEFGRTVIFETSDMSWHGHPFPAQRWRYSVAAYFFSTEQPPGFRDDHSTVFWNA